jgi:hypothetical protein
MASAQKSLVDVVIVGAGPAGLMCATALAAAGITVRIIDKRAQQVMIGHADGVMPRSLEVLQVRTAYSGSRLLLKENGRVTESWIHSCEMVVVCTWRYGVSLFYENNLNVSYRQSTPRDRKGALRFVVMPLSLTYAQLYLVFWHAKSYVLLYTAYKSDPLIASAAPAEGPRGRWHFEVSQKDCV